MVRSRQPNGTFVSRTKHASRGGKPYPKETREEVIAIYQNGGWAALKTPQLVQLRHQKKFPSLSTCKRWIDKHHQTGHVLPKRPTGNHYSQREVQGIDLVNLALFRIIRPKAYIDDVRAYLHNRNPANLPYSRSQIYRAEERLGLSRKVASTTSDMAYTPLNLFKRRNYWRESYPRGIFGEDIEDMIDLDEMAVKLESQNRGRGKVVRDKRCDARGKYKKGAGKVSLIMGIGGESTLIYIPFCIRCISLFSLGSRLNPFSFHRQYDEGGTNLWRFYSFMSDFIDWLAVNRPNRSFCFTMDNLNIHKNPIILNLIHNAGHRVVFRAPYWSCDGPIEYVFNTIHYKLQMEEEGKDSVEDLMYLVDDIIFEITGHSFYQYFIHVGFQP